MIVNISTSWKQLILNQSIIKKMIFMILFQYKKIYHSLARIQQTFSNSLRKESLPNTVAIFATVVSCSSSPSLKYWKYGGLCQTCQLKKS